MVLKFVDSGVLSILGNCSLSLFENLFVIEIMTFRRLALSLSDGKKGRREARRWLYCGTHYIKLAFFTDDVL
jgi:hypothetical protein